MSQQQPGDLGTPGLSTPDSGQPAATPFTPGLEGRGTATVATIQEARFGPALVKDLQQQFASLQDGDVRTVELRLDPPELGKVTVRISVVGEEARVVFAAAQGGARELLESTLPRLREMFEEAGLTLGEAAVDSGKRDGSPKRQAPGPLADGMDAHDLESQSLLDREEGGVNSSAPGRLDLHA
ncbi:MAG: flagellar hook-length control protein FliK [Pseudomonadales bacterium]